MLNHPGGQNYTYIESIWRAMVWVGDKEENAVIDSLKKVYKWTSTRWWQSLHTRMMKEDPETHKMEAEAGVAQSRECVG